MTVLLTNHEYDFLFKRGGDDLIAVFAIIRNHKNGEVYRKEGRKGVTRLLHERTKISVATLKKHLPVLIDLGLVEKHDNGNLLVRSRKWSNNNLPRQKNHKLIPIQICKNFIQTRRRSYFVRVHSNIKSQERRIAKRRAQIKLLTEEPRNLRDYKAKKSLLKKKSQEEVTSNYCENTRLSNRRFNALKKGKRKSDDKANYQKKKLLEEQLIGQQRNVSFFRGIYLDDLSKGMYVTSKGTYKEGMPNIYLQYVS